MARRDNKIVYKVTNIINNKIYIGWCTDFKERKSRHLRKAKIGVINHFYNAIRKYGVDNFMWENLYSDLDSFDTCKKLECQLIVEYDSYYNGYNSTLGGDGGDTYSKLSENRKKEMRKKCSKNSAKYWKNKMFSEEHKQKLKIANRSKQYKSVIQKDNMGNIIKIWGSIKEAVNELNIINGSHISRSARAFMNNKLLKAYGFYWEYNN